MSALCFGTYAQALQKVVLEHFKHNKELVSLLLDSITENTSGSITMRDGELFEVTDKYASELINRKDNVRKALKKAAEPASMQSAVTEYFADVIVPRIAPDMLMWLVDEIAKLVREEGSLEGLLGYKDRGEYPEFLSRAFLVAIKKDNRVAAQEEKDESRRLRDEAIENVRMIIGLVSRFKKPDPLKVPSEPGLVELVYIEALLAAYADAEGVKAISRNDLTAYNEKYMRNCDYCRICYFSAEAIRRGMRDCFHDDDSHFFDEYKDEVYDRIVDTLAMSYTNGFERLQKVLSHIESISIDCCFLGNINWMGARENKGVCQMLVNEKRIKWVLDE